jgi:hypothetical protein
MAGVGEVGRSCNTRRPGVAAALDLKQYAGARDGSHFVATAFLSSSLFYSEDGDYWRRIYVGNALGSDATYAAGKFMVFDAGPEIAESIDGQSWSMRKLDVGTIRSIYPRGGGAIGVGASCLPCEAPRIEKTQVLRLNEAGDWSITAEAGLPAAFAVAVAQNTIVVAAEDGMYVAVDDADGLQWQRTDVLQGFYAALFARGLDVFSLDFGIRVSRDGGFTWTREVTQSDGLRNE